MKDDFYYCINNDFELRKYPDSSSDLKLEINKLYYLSFGENMKFFDIYIDKLAFGPKDNYIGWTVMENSIFFKIKAEFLAEWRDKQIDNILNDE
jgi:hypothetical protein